MVILNTTREVNKVIWESKMLDWNLDRNMWQNKLTCPPKTGPALMPITLTLEGGATYGGGSVQC